MQWKEADFVSFDAHAGQLPTGIDNDMELMFRVLGCGDNCSMPEAWTSAQ
ncbi:hypothetical protein SynMVIR181_01961 [Synechococcus sp. MVIR-18-1]|nr:hypothetical protein SynMVIR181_01961 [Synechococcus sp. MVIR-18-1]